jgi:hypothetical protein
MPTDPGVNGPLSTRIEAASNSSLSALKDKYPETDQKPQPLSLHRNLQFCLLPQTDRLKDTMFFMSQDVIPSDRLVA